MTTYQKLKEENKRLKEDINKILDKDELTILRYGVKRSMEDSVFFGKFTDMQDVFGGLPVTTKVNRFDLITKEKR